MRELAQCVKMEPAEVGEYNYIWNPLGYSKLICSPFTLEDKMKAVMEVNWSQLFFLEKVKEYHYIVITYKPITSLEAIYIHLNVLLGRSCC